MHKTSNTKRYYKSQIALLFAVATITGCSSLPETITGAGNTHWGYAPEDPCIRCGESWVVLPNQEMAALKQAKQQPGFTDADYERELIRMYGQNWRELTPNWGKK
jgi:hypothetical protein